MTVAVKGGTIKADVRRKRQVYALSETA